MFVGLLFWFQFYCGFSASAMIDQWYLIFFNLLFSSLPQLVTGVLDKDVPADVLLTKPQLYKSGQNREVRLPVLLPESASPSPPSKGTPWGVPIVAQRLTNPARIHEDAGWIPGLSQWVKDTVLPRAVV